MKKILDQIFFAFLFSSDIINIMAKHRKSTRKSRKPASAGIKLKLKALRKLAKSHGLKVGGKKGSLIARLRRSGALGKSTKKSRKGRKSTRKSRKSRKCKKGVNKITGKCLKHKRSKKSGKSRKSRKSKKTSRRCKYGVSKRKSRSGRRKCLKSPRK